MINRQDILDCGWEEGKFKNTYFIELPAGTDTVQEFFLKENNGGPEFTIKSKLSGKFATHADVHYFGDIPDKRSLLLLMDLLGIKPLPPKKEYLIYDKVQDGQYNVTNGQRVIAQLEQSSDGSFYFWLMDYKGGCWSNYILREIADKLDELNAPWEELIRQQVEKDKMNDPLHENDDTILGF